ncbi:MAG: UDP-N-acetylglucosamine transferase subunit [Sporothrix epigloea]
MGFLFFSLVGITMLGMLLLLVIFRIYIIKSAQRGAMDKAWKAAQQGPVHDNARLPNTYIMYVLGSGGHTGELCEMIKQQYRPDPRSHRRYVITSGDRHSINAVERLEGLLSQAYPSDASTASQRDSWDIFYVVRARRVHQPLYTAWFSALQSALSVIQALLSPPKAATGHRLSKGDETINGHAEPFIHPDLIVTNGPGTGFIVCLMAFALKIACVIPTNRCCILFVETWAHVSTLSLTGKLFYYSRIADLFVVQHEPLAEKTGKRFIGDVTRYGNLLGIRKPFRRELPKSQPEETYVK